MSSLAPSSTTTASISAISISEALGGEELSPGRDTNRDASIAALLNFSDAALALNSDSAHVLSAAPSCCHDKPFDRGATGEASPGGAEEFSSGRVQDASVTSQGGSRALEIVEVSPDFFQVQSAQAYSPSGNTPSAHTLVHPVMHALMQSPAAVTAAGEHPPLSNGGILGNDALALDFSQGQLSLASSSTPYALSEKPSLCCEDKTVEIPTSRASLDSRALSILEVTPTQMSELRASATSELPASVSPPVALTPAKSENHSGDSRLALGAQASASPDASIVSIGPGRVAVPAQPDSGRVISRHDRSTIERSVTPLHGVNSGKGALRRNPSELDRSVAREGQAARAAAQPSPVSISQAHHRRSGELLRPDGRTTQLAHLRQSSASASSVSASSASARAILGGAARSLIGRLDLLRVRLFSEKLSLRGVSPQKVTTQRTALATNANLVLLKLRPGPGTKLQQLRESTGARIRSLASGFSQRLLASRIRTLLTKSNLQPQSLTGRALPGRQNINAASARFAQVISYLSRALRMRGANLPPTSAREAAASNFRGRTTGPAGTSPAPRSSRIQAGRTALPSGSFQGLRIIQSKFGEAQADRLLKALRHEVQISTARWIRQGKGMPTNHLTAVPKGTLKQLLLKRVAKMFGAGSQTVLRRLRALSADELLLLSSILSMTRVTPRGSFRFRKRRLRRKARVRVRSAAHRKGRIGGIPRSDELNGELAPTSGEYLETETLQSEGEPFAQTEDEGLLLKQELQPSTAGHVPQGPSTALRTHLEYVESDDEQSARRRLLNSRFSSAL